MRWSTTIEALPIVVVQAELASCELISIIPRPRSSLVTDSMAFCAANYHGAPDCVTVDGGGETAPSIIEGTVCEKSHNAAIVLISRNQGYITRLFPCVCIFRLALPEDRRAVLCPRHPPRESWLGLGAFALCCWHYLLRSLYAKSTDGATYTTDATACDALLWAKISLEPIMSCMSTPLARRTDKARVAPAGRARCEAGRGKAAGGRGEEA